MSLGRGTKTKGEMGRSVARKKEECLRNLKAEETAWRGWAFVSVDIGSRKTGETEVHGTVLGKDGEGS